MIRLSYLKSTNKEITTNDSMATPQNIKKPLAVVTDIDEGPVNDSMGDEEIESAVETQFADLDAPELYLNRELTWLEFNFRVLHEAQDDKNPLLERLKFAAIVSSNLDEFFMKRIGGLKQP
eukprot:UN00124